MIYQRAPTDRELQVAAAFLSSPIPEVPEASTETLDAWAQLAQVLLIANEIMFID
jgi:hypothetical protein